MRLRPLLFCLFLLGAGCDDGTAGQTDDVFNSETDSLVAPARDGRPSKTFPTPGKSCDAQQTVAKNLLRAHQSCAADADCVVESVAAKCLNAFMCPVPVARDTDLKKLRSEAADLAAAYQKRCGDVCAIAKCLSPESGRVFCNAETKRCDVAYRPAEEVDAGAAVLDAGTAPSDPTPIDPIVGCVKDADCAVKNAPNCCGYQPRCANVAAKFSPPKCDGRADICGFQPIDACTCQANKCVPATKANEI